VSSRQVPFKGIKDHEKWRAFASLLHGSAQLYIFLILFGQNLEKSRRARLQQQNTR
jgi:hypothetical protein